VCMKCHEVVLEHFPDIPKEEIGDFLMNCTAYPMGSEEMIAQQLIELRQKTSNYKACYRIVEDEMEAMMQEYQKNNPDE
jgi:hypothetical protein